MDEVSTEAGTVGKPQWIPWRLRTTETGIPDYPVPTGPSARHTPVTTWMSSGGTLVLDRGYPRCPWPVVFRIGNHVVYKEEDSTGGYPITLHKLLQSKGWESSRYLAWHSIPVPGMTATYWVPNWYLQTYLREMNKTWDTVREEVFMAATDRNRYLGMRSAHRSLYIKPWISSTLDRLYPDQHALAGMGFQVDRDALVDELTNTAMKNYPSPQDLVDSVAASAPVFWEGTPPPKGVPAHYSLWTPDRIATMARAAADLQYWGILPPIKSIRRYLEVNPRTGRHEIGMPTASARHFLRRVNRLTAWEGPGADHGYATAVQAFVSDFHAAPPEILSTHPDNPYRRHFLIRLDDLHATLTNPEYLAAKLKYWSTGNPEDAPRTRIDIQP